MIESHSLYNSIALGDTPVISARSFDEDGATPEPAVNFGWALLKPDGSTVTVSTAAAPAVTVTPQAGALSGTFQYIQTLIVGGYETASSPAAQATLAAQQARVNYIDVTGVAGATKRRLYRKASTADEWELILETTTLTASFYTDNTAPGGYPTQQPTFVNLDDKALLRILAADANQAGAYQGRSTFTLADGTVKSQPFEFDVFDPLFVSTTDIDKTVDVTWMMLEDCFDSEEGGPYLRDATLRYFNKQKVKDLADQALMAINLKPPVSAFTQDSFPYGTARPLLAKAMLIQAIKHLMRSYVEQPLVDGGGVAYLDRRDYLNRWQVIYQQELDEFGHWLALFKRGYYEFGSASILVDMKSGRRQIYPPSIRSRGRWW